MDNLELSVEQRENLRAQGFSIPEPPEPKFEFGDVTLGVSHGLLDSIYTRVLKKQKKAQDAIAAGKLHVKTPKFALVTFDYIANHEAIEASEGDLFCFSDEHGVEQMSRECLENGDSLKFVLSVPIRALKSLLKAASKVGYLGVKFGLTGPAIIGSVQAYKKNAEEHGKQCPVFLEGDGSMTFQETDTPLEILRGQLPSFTLISYCQVSRPGMGEGDLLKKVSRKDRVKLAKAAGQVGKANIDEWIQDKKNSDTDTTEEDVENLTIEQLEELVNNSSAS